MRRASKVGLTSSLLFLIAGLTAPAVVYAQNTTAPAPAPKKTTTTVHHRATTAASRAHAAAAAAEAGPVLPPGVPATPGKVETAFALRYVDSKVGEGDPVTPGQYITVHYTGWLASNGTKFDSSVDRGAPFTFPQGMHRVITGWDQGFTGMKVGGKRRLFIPYQLAYGEDGRPPVIPAKSDLIFDIELLGASATPPPPPGVPAQPAAQPGAGEAKPQ